MAFLQFAARTALVAPFFADGASALLEPRPHVQRAEVVVAQLRHLIPGVHLSEEVMSAATRVLGVGTLCAALAFSLRRAPRLSGGVLAAIGTSMAALNAPLWTAKTQDEKASMLLDFLRRMAPGAGALAIALSSEANTSPSAVCAQ